MYFDVFPKCSREDLFGREKELDALQRLVDRVPLILVLGLRRTGKTSLVRTFLAESNRPHLLLDLRELEGTRGLGKRELTEFFLRGLNEFLRENERWKSSILHFFGRIRGIKIGPVGFEIEPASSLSLPEVFDAFDEFCSERGIRGVFVLDEAQELAKFKFIDFRSLLSHAYDYHNHTTFILTGSKIGLLYRFLMLEDPESPLYGRHVERIELGRLSMEEAHRFMEEGFKQAKMVPPPGLIERAVTELDGIIGWLTNVGAKCLRKCDPEAVDEVVKEGMELVLAELGHFLSMRQAARAYICILRLAAMEGGARWSTIKEQLERTLQKKIYDKNLSQMLEALCDAGFLWKSNGQYSVSDPVLRRALLTFTEKEILRKLPQGPNLELH
jgi:AAA+ ATPase superfamily predicted ATPase